MRYYFTAYVIPDRIRRKPDCAIRNPAQKFAEGGTINAVAFGEPLRWIPDTVPLRFTVLE
jgi:hypothetical protein